jgi:hypothetical protein
MEQPKQSQLKDQVNVKVVEWNQNNIKIFLLTKIEL